MAENAKWYVIHTYSGYENKVATNIEKSVENRSLQDLIPEVRVPTETVTEIKDNKKREVERKIFPGYVLVKMVLTDDSWYVVRNTRGVTGFVEVKQIEVNYAVGNIVAIVDGPLEGFTGVVEELDLDKNKVKVVVSMFGRETPVELELDQAQLEN